MKKKTYEILLKIGHSIFEIGCLNVFWSSLYAKLFHDLIKQFNIDGIISNCKLPDINQI